jgi:hypothetical protein
MDTATAYAQLGLEPLDQFLGKTEGRHKIGATTWMLVEAALAVMEGQDIVVVGHTLSEAQELASTITGYVERLGGALSVRSFEPRAFDVGDGRVRWASLQTYTPDPARKAFVDAEWKSMAVRRRTGPYESIRQLVRRPDGDFNAFDERGELLMTIENHAARRFAAEHPVVVSFIE